MIFTVHVVCFRLRMSVDGGENKKNIKKTPNDFIFGKVIGEGSYSTVSVHLSKSSPPPPTPNKKKGQEKSLTKICMCPFLSVQVFHKDNWIWLLKCFSGIPDIIIFEQLSFFSFAF